MTTNQPQSLGTLLRQALDNPQTCERKSVRIVKQVEVMPQTHGLMLDFAGTMAIPREVMIPHLMKRMGVKIEEAMTSVCNVYDLRREIDALEEKLAGLQERLAMEQMDAQLRVDDLMGLGEVSV